MGAVGQPMVPIANWSRGRRPHRVGGSDLGESPTRVRRIAIASALLDVLGG
ncbi:hypothetical protein MMSP_3943 [Mycobacterium sp. 012931]|nr:hypothetical protein MMSP_3943 [Mycobacterium sp. 012931]